MISIEKYTVSINGIIKDAVELINKNKSRCVVAVNEDYKVFGVVSEGDILRILIDGKNIYTPIRNSININFKYLNYFDKKKSLNLVRNYGITLIPIVDENLILKDVISIHDLIPEF
tara:strand:+ start:966 stop:1313 length:348 start_codon:yes stop_codon:yes gene_type:complete